MPKHRKRISAAKPLSVGKWKLVKTAILQPKREGGGGRGSGAAPTYVSAEKEKKQKQKKTQLFRKTNIKTDKRNVNNHARFLVLFETGDR